MRLFTFSGLKKLRPGRFDPTRERWAYADPATGTAHVPGISCATFNVWFGERFFEDRCKALLDLLEQRRPDVVALQEVTRPFLATLCASDWLRREYAISDFRGSTLSDPPYGVVMLTRLPVASMELHDLPSRMGRRVLVAHLLVNDMRLAVATVHLESLDSAPQRGQQLGQIFTLLKDERDAVLMGDFNFCSSWAEEQANLDPEYVDVWPALRAGEPGYTEDTNVNLMLASLRDEEKTVRFDRVLVRSGTPGWVPETIELLGTTPIASDLPDIFPSDHFGLFTRLRWQG